MAVCVQLVLFGITVASMLYSVSCVGLGLVADFIWQHPDTAHIRGVMAQYYGLHKRVF